MAIRFDALDALCAVSIEANRHSKKESVDISQEVENAEMGMDEKMFASQTTFVKKLLQMLDDDQDQHMGNKNDVVCWGPEGRTVIIGDPAVFSQTVLPKFFKHK